MPVDPGVVAPFPWPVPGVVDPGPLADADPLPAVAEPLALPDAEPVPDPLAAPTAPAP